MDVINKSCVLGVSIIHGEISTTTAWIESDPYRLMASSAKAPHFARDSIIAQIEAGYVGRLYDRVMVSADVGSEHLIKELNQLGVFPKLVDLKADAFSPNRFSDLKTEVAFYINEHFYCDFPDLLEGVYVKPDGAWSLPIFKNFSKQASQNALMAALSCFHDLQIHRGIDDPV